MKKLLILFCLIIIQVQGQVDVTQDPRILNLLNQNKFNPKYRNQQQDASNPHYSSRITVRGREYGAYGKVRDFKQVNQNVVRVLNSTITGGGFVQEQVGIATAYRYTMPVTNKNHSSYLSQLARNYGKVSRKKTITYKEGFSSEIENSASTLLYKPNYKVVTKHVYNPNKKGSRGFVDTTMQLKGVVTRTVYTGTCPVGRGHIVNEEVARADYNLHKAQTSYNELLMQNKIHEAKYLNQYYHKYNSSLRQARVPLFRPSEDPKDLFSALVRFRIEADGMNGGVADGAVLGTGAEQLADKWIGTFGVGINAHIATLTTPGPILAATKADAKKFVSFVGLKAELGKGRGGAIKVAADAIKDAIAGIKRVPDGPTFFCGSTILQAHKYLVSVLGFTSSGDLSGKAFFPTLIGHLKTLGIHK